MNITLFRYTRLFGGTNIISHIIYVSCQESGCFPWFKLSVRPLLVEAIGKLTCQTYCPASPRQHANDSLPLAGAKGQYLPQYQQCVKWWSLFFIKTTSIVIPIKLGLIFKICFCRCLEWGSMFHGLGLYINVELLAKCHFR